MRETELFFEAAVIFACSSFSARTTSSQALSIWKQNFGAVNGTEFVFRIVGVISNIFCVYRLEMHMLLLYFNQFLISIVHQP